MKQPEPSYETQVSKKNKSEQARTIKKQAISEKTGKPNKQKYVYRTERTYTNQQLPLIPHRNLLQRQASWANGGGAGKWGSRSLGPITASPGRASCKTRMHGPAQCSVKFTHIKASSKQRRIVAASYRKIAIKATCEEQSTHKINWRIFCNVGKHTRNDDGRVEPQSILVVYAAKKKQRSNSHFIRLPTMRNIRNHVEKKTKQKTNDSCMRKGPATPKKKKSRQKN